MTMSVSGQWKHCNVENIIITAKSGARVQRQDTNHISEYQMSSCQSQGGNLEQFGEFANIVWSRGSNSLVTMTPGSSGAERKRPQLAFHYDACPLRDQVTSQIIGDSHKLIRGQDQLE